MRSAWLTGNTWSLLANGVRAGAPSGSHPCSPPAPGVPYDGRPRAALAKLPMGATGGVTAGGGRGDAAAAAAGAPLMRGAAFGCDVVPKGPAAAGSL